MFDLLDRDAFFVAYVEAALWSSTDNTDDSGGRPLDENYGPSDIHPKCLDQMRAECKDFIDYCEANGDLMAGLAPDMCGHDFWLTRNHHGAGFWDRGLGKQGEKLTKAAHAWGESDLYVDDDGMIHAFP